MSLAIGRMNACPWRADTSVLSPNERQGRVQVQVNTDSNIEGREGLVRHVEAEVIKLLGRFGDYVTRVEVHLSDVNGAKSGSADKRCIMEARPAGHQPIAASCDGDSLEASYIGAARKMQRLLTATLERQHDHKGANPAKHAGIEE